MAHNKVEELYHFENYKQKFCSTYPNRLMECEYGEFCSFAHSESEIKTELLHNYVFDSDFYIFHYKTLWCPFNLTQHDKALCVYAHNWQDFRRKPNVYEYEPEACNSWNPSEFIDKYIRGCPQGLNCNKCHGWKELEYHPYLYKLKQCKMMDHCIRDSHCPMYHSAADRRVVDQRVEALLTRFCRGL